ncbi:MAG TPA: hypothetical protein PLJ78_09325 [Anaerolineae bacterium]|nr:hypothetical protein [Anaerolineae bacterium]HQK14128.1 hypothetical protein [Anaerolineae bacterium]
MTIPSGEERKVKFLGGAAIDGAPVAYIVVLAAVVAALCFIPFSVILALGGSFPIAQGIFPLVGWILGPIAGAIASGVGRLIGVFVAPHTAAVPAVSVWSAMVGSFSAGVMKSEGKRKSWWLPLTIFFILEFLLFVGRAIVQNGVSPRAAFAGSFLDWSGILLFALPTRTLAARWLRHKNIGVVAAGLFLGTWMIAGVTHLTAAMITYFMSNWPEDVWVMLIPIIPVENLFRCLVGTVIGSGVIAGLRAIGIVKPTEATY